MKLDIGGRVNAPEGWKTLEKNPPADFVCDLEGPLHGIPTGWVREIRAHHVLEHIRNLCPLMDRLWEALAPGGTLDIEVPHKDHGAAWHDPTHVRYFTMETFDYFTEKLAYFGYVQHTWEYLVAPHMTGVNKDFVGVVFRKPL